MNVLMEKFHRLSSTPSDINEHLPAIFNYAKHCDSAIELGVRGCVSSWAIAAGLLNNKNGVKKKFFMNDLQQCQVSSLVNLLNSTDIEVKCEWKNDLDIVFEPNETYDLVFIDTLHVYGQIKRELEKFSPIANKYIIMHDTTVDEIGGEILRHSGYNHQSAYPIADNLSKNTGIPTSDFLRGMEDAIQEFLQRYSEWRIKERFTNNNGLTILSKS